MWILFVFIREKERGEAEWGCFGSKQRENPLPAKERTFCLVLPEALPCPVIFKSALMRNIP
jgi:hypothetical protein